MSVVPIRNRKTPADGKIAKSGDARRLSEMTYYLQDHHAFGELAHNWVCTVLPGAKIEYRDTMRNLTKTIKDFQGLLDQQRTRTHKAQALRDLSEIHKICEDFLNRTLSNMNLNSNQINTKSIDDIFVELLDSITEITKRTISNRPEQKKFAILRLRRAAGLADVWFGATKQKEGDVRDELEKISSEELLLAVAEKEEVPLPNRQTVCAEAMRAFKRAKARTLREGDAWRPKWQERPESLKPLTAPLFLKKVWADLFDKEGNLIDEERIRNYDSKLIQVVQQYIAKRLERGQDLGHATGLSLTNKGWNGPSQNQPKAPSVSPRLKHIEP